MVIRRFDCPVVTGGKLWPRCPAPRMVPKTAAARIRARVRDLRCLEARNKSPQLPGPQLARAAGIVAAAANFFFWPRVYAARAGPPGPRWSRGPGGRGNAAVALRELRKPPRPAPSCCASWPSARTNGRVTGNVACSMHVAINNTLCGRCHDEGCTVEWRYTFQYNQTPIQHHRGLSIHATSPSHLCCCSAAACSCQVAMNALLS